MRRFDWVYLSIKWATILSLSMLSLLVAYQVMARYVPIIPHSMWTEEIVRILFTWMVMLGTAVAAREGTHFVMDIIPSPRRPLPALVHHLVSGGLSAIVVGSVMTLGGIRFAETGVDRIAPASGIPMVWAFAAVPFAGLSIVLFGVEEALTSIKEYRRKAREDRNDASEGIEIPPKTQTMITEETKN